MVTIGITEARAKLPELIDKARDEPVFVQRHGRTAAVLISPAQYDRLVEALDEDDDVAAFDRAMAEEGPDLPWEQVKSDLGWE